jgi:hypothetical protein
VYERKHLIADLAAREDQTVRVVALTAIWRQDVDLDGFEGELIYLNTQLGWEIVEACAFVVWWRRWTAQRG